MSGYSTPRRHRRFPIKVPIFIKAVGGETLQKMISIESRDISAGGVSFETSKKVALDADSRVVLARVGDLPDNALIHARVVHRERDPATGRYTVGLEFTEFVNVTREDLVARIEGWKG